MNFFSYIFPATLLHFGLVLVYDLIWLAGYAGPIDRWWLSLEDQRSTVYILAYVALVALIGTLGVTRRWNISLRWVLELGARRGLRIGGVPLLDLGLLALCGAIALLVVNLAPQSADLLFYLIGPLVFALTVNLLFGLPPELSAVAERQQNLAEFARAAGRDPGATARENGLDPLDIGAPVAFAQELRLPVSGATAARPAATPTPPPTPTP